MVNLELYKIFKIVADEENLTRASEILNISQPAVTKHIHNLENELQIKLFQRTKYGMKLTNDGKSVYNQIKESITILMNVEASIKQVTMLNLGVHLNIPTKLCRSILSNIKREHLNIDINILKSFTENMFNMLEKQEIDAYLSKKQPSDLYNNKTIEFVPLGTFHDKFFVNANSKYLNKDTLLNEMKNITIYTLRNVSSTNENLIHILKEKDIKNANIKNMTFSTIMEEIKNKDIIAYLTEEYINEEILNNDLRILDMGFAAQPIEYGIYYNSNNKIKNIKNIIKNINKY